MDNSLVINTLIQAKEALVKERAASNAVFDSKIASYEDAINKLLGNSQGTPIPKKRGRKPKNFISSGYPLTGTVLQKMKFILSEAGKYLDINQIADRVKVYEPNEDSAVIKKQFTKHAGKWKQNGDIKSYYKDGNIHYTMYGLPSFPDVESGK